MKKVGSILIIAMMAFGLTAYVAESTKDEFKFMKDLSTMIACDDCATSPPDRDPPENA